MKRDLFRAAFLTGALVSAAAATLPGCGGTDTGNPTFSADSGNPTSDAPMASPSPSPSPSPATAVEVAPGS